MNLLNDGGTIETIDLNKYYNIYNLNYIKDCLCFQNDIVNVKLRLVKNNTEFSFYLCLMDFFNLSINNFNIDNIFIYIINKIDDLATYNKDIRKNKDHIMRILKNKQINNTVIKCICYIFDINILIIDIKKRTIYSHYVDGYINIFKNTKILLKNNDNYGLLIPFFYDNLSLITPIEHDICNKHWNYVSSDKQDKNIIDQSTYFLKIIYTNKIINLKTMYDFNNNITQEADAGPKGSAIILKEHNEVENINIEDNILDDFFLESDTDSENNITNIIPIKHIHANIDNMEYLNQSSDIFIKI